MSADLGKHWWDSVEQIAKSFRRVARCLEGCEFISQQGCRPNNKDNVPAEGIEWKVAVAQSMVCWYKPVNYCCQSWFKSCQRMWAPTLWDSGRFHIPLIQIKALAGKLQCIVGWWRSWSAVPVESFTVTVSWFKSCVPAKIWFSSIDCVGGCENFR